MINFINAVAHTGLLIVVVYILRHNFLRNPLKISLFLIGAGQIWTLTGYFYRFVLGWSATSATLVFFSPASLVRTTGTAVAIWTYRNLLFHLRKLREADRREEISKE